MESRGPLFQFTPQEISNALEAAENSSPETIIINTPHEIINILNIGCQGSGDENQRKVAELLNEVAAEFPPVLVLFGGDNFYPDGAESPNDPCFEKKFHSTYNNPDLKNICDIEKYVVLGNHDYGFDKASEIKTAANHLPVVPYVLPYITKYNFKKGTEAGLQQIAHSYLLKNSRAPQSFIMPHAYYDVIINDEIHLMVLNSNTYIKDFLDFIKAYAHDEKIHSEKNQVCWLQKKVKNAMAANKTIVLAMHHPVETVGKRAYPASWDAKHYLDPLSITLIKKILKILPDPNIFLGCENETSPPEKIQEYKKIIQQIFAETHSASPLEYNASYNNLIYQGIYIQQGIHPHVICTAHDHHLNYINTNYANPKKNKTPPANFICQAGSGGGGETLHDRYFFSRRKHLAGFKQAHGLSVLSFKKNNPEKIFDIYLVDTNREYLHFNNLSGRPIQAPISDEKTRQFRNYVLEACDEYEKFLSKQQKYYRGGQFNFSVFHNPHSQKEVAVLHKVKNFFNQPVFPDYDKSVEFLTQSLEEIYYKTDENSLYLKVNEKLKKWKEAQQENIPIKEESRMEYSFTLV